MTAAIAAAVVAGCSGSDEPDRPAGTATETAETTGAADPAVEIPDTPVGAQARWALEQLEAAGGPSADEATARFDTSFLSHVPADDLASTFDQLRGYGPFEITEYQGTPTQAQVQVQSKSGDPMALEIVVDDAGMITGMLLRPIAEPPTIEGWPDLDAAYSDLPGARVFAADVVDGACRLVHTLGDADEAAPLGSVFKLYVLGAVQRAVLEGDVSWDDTVALTAEARVLASVETDALDDGTELSVADAARHMIVVSDNTATDLLIDLVGREAVEQAVRDMGHSHPAAMRPFIRARELFQLGWTDPALREEWAAAEESECRTMLDALPGGPLEVDPNKIVDPVHTYGMDWFASGADVCAAHATLQELAEGDTSGVVRDLLAVNPGVEIDSPNLPYVAFKGGSAPGVLAGSWYVEDTDSSGHVLVVQFAGDDPTALADVAYIMGTAGNALDLLSSAR